MRRASSLGIVAVAAVLAAGGCQAQSGEDPQTSATAATTDAPAATDASTGASSTAAADSADFEQVVTEDLAAAVAVIQGWWPDFVAPELRTIPLGETFGGVMTGCGRYPFTSGNAFYCAGDNTVYLDLNFLAGQDRYGKENGAALAITTHELGHAWEAQRGYRPDESETVVKTELFADCISGAIVAEMGGNEEAAARDAFASGDFAFDNPQHHGTPSQRRQATETGIEQGHEACDAYLR